eukprot:8560364-Pyramimonas_sp.AAC.2
MLEIIELAPRKYSARFSIDSSAVLQAAKAKKQACQAKIPKPAAPGGAAGAPGGAGAPSGQHGPAASAASQAVPERVELDHEDA